MIGAAGVAIKEVESQLASLGLLLLEDRDYGATFSNATHTLHVASEPHYPGLSISLRNACGETYELGLLARLIAPESYAKANVPRGKDSQEMFGLSNMVRFLLENKALVFEQPASYSAAYQEAAKLCLAKFGLSGAI
ncbi:MAG: hypothetical protein ABI144_02740 [Gallionella sp.]